jgi:hypothetical protein
MTDPKLAQVMEEVRAGLYEQPTVAQDDPQAVAIDQFDTTLADGMMRACRIIYGDAAIDAIMETWPPRP